MIYVVGTRQARLWEMLSPDQSAVRSTIRCRAANVGSVSISAETSNLRFMELSSYRVKTLVIDTASEGLRLDNFHLRVCKGVPKTHVYRIVRSCQVCINIHES